MLARLLTRIIDAQAIWSEPWGRILQAIVRWIFRPLPWLRDLLSGRWIGHPLHAALADFPIGALMAASLLDILDLRAAADAAVAFGIVLMLVSALSGLSDYSETDGLALRRATVHSSLMVVALVVYLFSLWLRLGAPADRTAPVVLGFIGLGLLLGAAYVGGDVVFVLGNMVYRHAFRAKGTQWVRLEVGDIPEGVPTKARSGAQALVLVRRGERVHALHDVCAHASCSLSGGSIVGETIECPCHGSRYRLDDGEVVRGPSVYDQPAYELRQAGEGWEARRIS